jgi:hypothetical protein
VNAFKYVIASLVFLLPTSSYGASLYAYTFSGTGFGKQQTFDYASGTSQSFYVSGDFSTTFIVDLDANDGSTGPFVGDGKSYFYSFGNRLPNDNGPYMTIVTLGNNGLNALLQSPEFYNVGTNVSVKFTSPVNQFSDISDATAFTGGNFSYDDHRYSSYVGVTGKITGFSAQAVSNFEQTSPVFSIKTSSPVPEVSSWLMMLAGFGLIGSAARHRKSTMATVRFA